jgi:hypothetical protein
MGAGCRVLPGGVLSRREAVIKAVSGALGPDYLDLAQYQRRSTRDPRQIKVRGDMAAAALAYASKDRVVTNKDGSIETIFGDPLAILLLRLKYAGEKDRQPVFEEAHAMLLERHMKWLREVSDLEVLYAVAIVALFEWLNDPCPVCRKVKRQREPRVCSCVLSGELRLVGGRRVRGRRESIDRYNSEGKRILGSAVASGPVPGCPSCHGIGRIFGVEKKSRGVWCVTCRNSGRAYLKHRQRVEMINDFIQGMGMQGIEVPDPLTERAFRDDWLPTYRLMVDAMRATDKEIAVGIDFGFQPSQNRRTESPSAQEQYAALAPPDAADGEDAT